MWSHYAAFHIERVQTTELTKTTNLWLHALLMYPRHVVVRHILGIWLIVTIFAYERLKDFFLDTEPPLVLNALLFLLTFSTGLTVLMLTVPWHNSFSGWTTPSNNVFSVLMIDCSNSNSNTMSLMAIVNKWRKVNKRRKTKQQSNLKNTTYEGHWVYYSDTGKR